MKRIVYTRPDGGVSIVTPAIADIDLILIKDVPGDATNVHICTLSDIPRDRTFRDAWEQGPDKLPKVNMTKARVIHMDRIRFVRDKELTRLDIEYQKADEKGDVVLKAQIATQKQALRDLTATFDLSVYTTPEALKLAWPPGLPEL